MLKRKREVDEQKLPQMTDEQQAFLDFVFKQKGSALLTGAAGTGKSYTLNKAEEEASKRGLTFVSTATTGIAATHINGGITFHGFMGCGLAKASAQSYIRKIMKRKGVLKRWTETDILAVDECSMLDFALLRKFDEIARVLRKKNVPFGGMQLILVGDFAQLPPVNPKGVKYLFQSPMFSTLIPHVVYLTKIFRQKEQAFMNFLHRVRIGRLTSDDVNFMRSKVTEEKKYGPEDIKPTVIYTTNRDVDAMNENELRKLNQPLNTYQVIKTTESVDGTELNQVSQNLIDDWFNLMDKNCLARNTLELCVGAQVMLVANIDPPVYRYVNGLRGVVLAFTEPMSVSGAPLQKYPVVQFIHKGVKYEPRVITPHTWKYTHKNIELTYAQLPLKLAWSITVHKSQGMTLSWARLDLTHCFESGQAYTALSRVESGEGLELVGFKLSGIRGDPVVTDFYRKLANRSR